LATRATGVTVEVGELDAKEQRVGHSVRVDSPGAAEHELDRSGRVGGSGVWGLGSGVIERCVFETEHRAEDVVFELRDGLVRDV
jgi:hypothetical protein